MRFKAGHSKPSWYMYTFETIGHTQRASNSSIEQLSNDQCQYGHQSLSSSNAASSSSSSSVKSPSFFSSILSSTLPSFSSSAS
jgi:hypothetical protein